MPNCYVSCKRKWDLRRHEAAAHRSDKIYWCPFIGCTRNAERKGSGKPFPRKDKRDDHVRKVHSTKTLDTDPPAAFEHDATVAQSCAESSVSDATGQHWLETNPTVALPELLLSNESSHVDSMFNWNLASLGFTFLTASSEATYYQRTEENQDMSVYLDDSLISSFNGVSSFETVPAFGEVAASSQVSPLSNFENGFASSPCVFQAEYQNDLHANVLDSWPAYL